MAAGVEPPGEAAEQHVFRGDEAARRERHEEVFDDVDPGAFWVEVQPEAHADPECIGYKCACVRGVRTMRKLETHCILR